MVTEKEFLHGIAEIILGVFNNEELGLTKSEVSKDGHFTRDMLTNSRLLSMRSDTLMRLLLYLGISMPDRDFYHLFLQLYRHLSYVANHDEFSAYNIIDSHAGSPIGRRALLNFM